MKNRIISYFYNRFYYYPTSRDSKYRTHDFTATIAVSLFGDLGGNFLVDTSIAQPFTIFTSCDRCALQFMSACKYETLPEVLTRAIRDPPAPDVSDVPHGL
jgi:hypothetical protein